MKNSLKEVTSKKVLENVKHKKTRLQSLRIALKSQTLEQLPSSVASSSGSEASLSLAAPREGKGGAE